MDSSPGSHWVCVSKVSFFHLSYSVSLALKICFAHVYITLSFLFSAGCVNLFSLFITFTLALALVYPPTPKTHPSGHVR